MELEEARQKAMQEVDREILELLPKVSQGGATDNDMWTTPHDCCQSKHTRSWFRDVRPPAHHR
jgi:hypothetical protein